MCLFAEMVSAGEINLVVSSLLMCVRSRPHSPAFPRASLFSHAARVDRDLVVISRDFNHVIQSGSRLRAVFGDRAKRPRTGDANLPRRMQIADEICSVLVHVAV